jgi:putative hydrolase of the HAD superfamily
MFCAVFDVDDTLYLERDYVRSGFHAAGVWAEKELGVPDFSERALREFQCGGRGDIFDRVLASYGLSDIVAVGHLVQAYRSHVPSITLLPDASQCLSVLRPHCHLAIITDGAVDSQRNKVHALGLTQKVDLIVLTGEWGAEFSKPNPRSFEYVQQQLTVSPECCVYIGDNPSKDFATPRGLGWRTVRIRREGGLHFRSDAAAGYAADREFGDLRQVHEMLLNR